MPESVERGGWQIWAAGVIIGLLVLMAGWLVLTDPPAAESTTTTAAQSLRTEDNDESETQEEPDESAPGCPKDLPVNSQIPTQGPDVRWEVYRGAVISFSDVHGPMVVDDDIPTCYSRTPTGALIAGQQNVARMVLSDNIEPVNRALSVPGPGQDRRVKILVDRGVAQTPPGSLCQVAGFRFIFYDETRAIISYASSCPDGSIQLTESTLVWDSGTWLSELEPDGSTSPTVSTASNLAGMTVWGGV